MTSFTPANSFVLESKWDGECECIFLANFITPFWQFLFLLFFSLSNINSQKEFVSSVRAGFLIEVRNAMDVLKFEY